MVKELCYLAPTRVSAPHRGTSLLRGVSLTRPTRAAGGVGRARVQYLPDPVRRQRARRRRAAHAAGLHALVFVPVRIEPYCRVRALLRIAAPRQYSLLELVGAYYAWWQARAG